MRAILLNQSQINRLNECPTVCVTARGFYFKLDGGSVHALRMMPEGWVTFGKFDSVDTALKTLTK